MSNLKKTDETEKSLLTKDNNLLEKFTSDDFAKITTRAGAEEFALTTIDDEKMKAIAERMDEVNRGLNAFAKTNTQFVSLALTLSEATPERNIRQIHAQIESKRGALSESQFRLLKQQNELKRKLLIKSEIVEAECGEGKKYKSQAYKELELERIDIDIEEIKAKMIDGRVHIEQAIKEIGLYQDAMEDIIRNNNLENWDEKDMEEADIKYNLVRCFYQSLRSCRQIGHINEPNQEWLEQLGINPSFVQSEMLSFLDGEKKVMQAMIEKNEGFGDNMDEVDKFVNHLYEKYKNMPIDRIKSRGINSQTYDKWLYIEEDKKDN